MTLNKSIKAAKDGLEWALKPSMGDAGESWRAHKIKAGLSTLPAKPMTEEELMQILKDKADITCSNTRYDIMRALRNEGVLYVEEKK